MNIKLPDDELIPDAELADEWGCTTRTLRRYEHEPNGLAYVLVGGRKFRLVKGSAAWLGRRVRRPNPPRCR